MSIPAFVLGMNETGLTAVRCLGREGIKVHGFDVAAKRVGFRSRYCSEGAVCPDPVREADQLVQFLRSRAGSEQAVLLPTSDLFFLFISRHRAALSDKFLMSLPAPDVAEDVVNKRRLYERAEAAGIDFPQSFFPRTCEEAAAIKDAVPYPAFIKPYWGHQWRSHFGPVHKGFKVHSPEEFLARFAEVAASGHPALVQSYIQSADDNLFSVSLYMNQAGHAVGAFARRQVRQFPPNSGTVTMAISEHNPELIASAVRLCQSIGYRGIAGLEFKRDRQDTEYKLLDFNPRLMLSDGLTAYCGSNLALLQYRDLTRKPSPDVSEYEDGVVWLASLADFEAFKLYYENGDLTFKSWLASIMRARVFALFASDDPLPFLLARKFGLSYVRALQYTVKQLALSGLRKSRTLKQVPS